MRGSGGGAAYRIVHFGLSQVAELRPNCTKAANRRSKLRILSGRAAHYDGVFPVRPCENVYVALKAVQQGVFPVRPCENKFKHN